MSEEQIAKIFTQLADHEARLKQLEGGTRSTAATTAMSVGSKQKTLRELVKGKKFKNGQEQIAAIVGYHERVLGQRIPKDKIKKVWEDAKMNGIFSPVYFSRAKDTLIRVDRDACDLTQTGDEFFNRLLNNEPIETTSS